MYAPKLAPQAAMGAGEAPHVEGDEAAVAADDLMEALDSLEHGLNVKLR